MSNELQRKLDEILKIVDGLERRVEDQQKTIDAQQKTIDRQRKKIHKLEAALAAAKKNSSNSSKPPSSDIVKPKKDNGNAPSDGATKKKPGGQPGHKGNFREEFPLENVDAVFEYTLSNCPHCGCKLENSDRAPCIVQQIKIVQKPIKIEEHRGIPYWCPECQCFHYAPFPKEVGHGGLFDAKLTSIVAYMKGVCHASYTTIRTYLRDIIGIKVSRGYLKKVLEKVSDSLLIPYDELRSALPLQSGLNIDESSLPENGKKLWIWTFEAELFSLYKIDPSRGSKVLIEMLGREFKGVIGCDYFSAYRKFMKEFNVVVQFCLAHLIRDIKYLAGLKDKATKMYGEGLRARMRELFALIHSRERYSPEDFAALMLAKKDEILRQVKENVPKNREAKNLAKRFENHGEYFFTFITTPEMEPTNNVAERAIRFVTIDRLVTQGVRGEWGRRFSERLWTVLRTCEKQGRDVLSYLEQTLLAFWHAEPPPSLLSSP